MNPIMTRTSATQSVVISVAGALTVRRYSAAAPEIWCATSLA
jgi:hypothetical protein